MKTYYEKKGRRYFPVIEADVWGHSQIWTQGFHLIECRPGSKTVRYNVEPDHSAVLAAQMMHSDELAKLIVDASKAELSAPSQITPEQSAAWEALKASFGGGPFYVNYESARGIARKFMSYLQVAFEGESNERDRGI
jgi:hypothetical protein